MNTAKLLIHFMTTFAVTFVVSVSVTLVWSLIAHGTGTIDWETSFRTAIVFGVIFSWMEMRRQTRN